MGWGDKVTCDEPHCGVERKESNHWYVVTVKDGAFMCWPFDKVAAVDGMKPVCGQQHAQKMLERFMTTGKL